jgi:hypothetical protein
MSVDLLKTIARLRRAMPRNADVTEVCDALEGLLQRRSLALPAVSSVPPVHAEQPAELKITRVPKFDKRAYMRDYMRKKRAKGRP